MKGVLAWCRVPILIAGLCLLSGCYLVKQGVNLLSHRSRAVKIDKALASDRYAEEVKRMLSLTLEVKRYATETLGLSEDRNYTKFVEVPGDYLVDVVSACEKDFFDPYEWRFPIFGSFPYKGFYKTKDAERLAARLRKKDLDVLISRVDSYSTLGFFVDPLYSFMTGYSDFQIASLVIHEQTHATVFLKNQVQFNEELATFVGWEGALAFLQRHYGEESQPVIDARAYLADWSCYFSLMLDLRDRLDRLYRRNRDAGIPKEETLRMREGLFDEFRGDFLIRQPEVFQTERFKSMNPPALNNAYLMSFVRYGDDLDLFYELYRVVDHDLPKCITIIKTLKDRQGDPKERLREIIEQRSAHPAN